MCRLNFEEITSKTQYSPISYNSRNSPSDRSRPRIAEKRFEPFVPFTRLFSVNAFSRSHIIRNTVIRFRCTNLPISWTSRQLPDIGISSTLNVNKDLPRSIFEITTRNRFATYNQMISIATSIYSASILALLLIIALRPDIFSRLLTALQWTILAVLIPSILISAISHSPGLIAIKRLMLPFACSILQIKISTAPIRKRCT